VKKLKDRNLKFPSQEGTGVDSYNEKHAIFELLIN
jgi:hypothetical protein